MAKKKRGGAHGGHGWFVTFADLMALLMSFFVMIAAYSTQDQKKMQAVAGSMREAFGVNRESRLAGIIEKDGLPAAGAVVNKRDIPPEKATDRPNNSAREMKSDVGLPETGQVDPATWPLLVKQTSLGSTGDAVRALQVLNLNLVPDEPPLAVLNATAMATASSSSRSSGGIAAPAERR